MTKLILEQPHTSTMRLLSELRDCIREKHKKTRNLDLVAFQIELIEQLEKLGWDLPEIIEIVERWDGEFANGG